MNRSQWLFIIPINFLYFPPSPQFCLSLTFFNQGPQQSWRGSLGCHRCQGEEEKEGGAGGQAVGGKLHAVTSRRIGALYSCQVGVEVTSISHFIQSPYFFSYFLHPTTYCPNSRREVSEERYLCGHRVPQAIPS